MCGLARRIQVVKKGENTCDVAGCKFAVGVLASYSGCAHALSQRLTNDMDHIGPSFLNSCMNRSLRMKDRSSMNALVVNELQKIENEAIKLFPVMVVVRIMIRQSLLVPLLFKEVGYLLLFQSVFCGYVRLIR